MKNAHLFTLSISTLLLLSACDAGTIATNPSSPATTATTSISTVPAENTPAVNLPTIPPTTTSANFSIKNQSIKETSQIYTVDVSYPTTGIAAIDSELKSAVDEQIALFKKDLAGVTPDEMVGINSISASYDYFNFNPQYFSIKFTFDTYTGGAHPNSFFITKTYDLNSAKPLALSDLFQPGSDYLEKISQHAIDSLKAQSIVLNGLPSDLQNADDNTKWITEGAGPKEENYRNWVITPNSLEIYFEAYQVASYAEGPKTVDIDLAELSKMLVPPFNQTPPQTSKPQIVNTPSVPSGCQISELPSAQTLGLKFNIYKCDQSQDYPKSSAFSIQKGSIYLKQAPDFDQPLVEVFTKPINQTPESAIGQIIKKLPADRQKNCIVQENKGFFTSSSIRAYQIKSADQSDCGTYGNGSGYFEFQDSNPEKYLFVNQDLGLNLFSSIEILPASPTNTVTTLPNVTLK